MLIISRHLRKMSKDSSIQQFCAGATRAIRAHYKEDLLPHLAFHPEDRLTASVVVFSRLRREVWMIGDCACLIDGTLYENPKPHERLLAEERTAIIKSSPAYQAWLAAGKGPIPPDLQAAVDAARQAIIPHMLQSMQQQNLTYSVLDGFPVAKSKVRVLPLDFSPHQLVLASDGYPFLCPTLAESEKLLARQREEDPLNIGPRFQATKPFLPGSNSFDDRAYIRFDI